MRLTAVISVLFIFINGIISAQTKPEGFKRNGISLMQSGKYAEAIDMFNKYISLVPRDAEGYYLRGLSQEKRQIYPSAIFDLRRAVKLDRGNSKYKKELARITEVWHKILRRQIEGYKREIAIDPSNPYNYLEIGKDNSHLHLEDFPTAEYWYDEYLKRDDNASPDEIIRYTLILQETGHITKGEKILKKYVERYPEDWRLWSRYGYFTLWLGKYKTAEKAFTNALGFKPFFKEAQDGLDLAKRQGYVTQYQSSFLDEQRRMQPQEYPVDRYYRIIRNNPGDDEARFSLIGELIDVGRYEEAYQQALILQPNYEEDQRFINYWDKITSYREAKWNEKIDEELIRLHENPANGDAAKNIAKYYTGLEKYDDAAEILKEYLQIVPGDAEADYQLAKVYSFQRDFKSALNSIDAAREIDSSNTKYKLFAGQLLTWDGSDFEKAKELLSEVIAREPNNVSALISLGLAEFSLGNIEEAGVQVDKAKSIDPNNPDVEHLYSMIDFEKMRLEDEKKLEILNQARALSQSGDYDGAIDLYNRYFEEVSPTDDQRLELADNYIGAERWDDALQEYDAVLENGGNYEVEKQRAKVYYWSGDSLDAFNEFQKLAEENPEDLETRLYLGDSYVKMGEYDKAREVYDSLKEVAPDSYMIDQRLAWIPDLSLTGGGLTDYLFSYLLFAPNSYYFNDNLDFEYMYYGGYFEVGLLRWLSVGASYNRGSLGNSWGRLNYTTFKGQLNIQPSKNILLSFGYGRMRSLGVIDQPVYDALFKIEEPKHYKAAFSFLRSNAAVILYSPSLVGDKMAANSFRFDWYYYFLQGTRIDGYYQFIVTDKTLSSPQNLGNTFNFRISKLFFPAVRIGYEFEYTDYKYDLNEYWTPDRYSHHALWGEWKVLDDGVFDFLIGGKVGYVPSADYILRAAWARFGYKILPNLKLAAAGYIGSTVQNIVGYSSGNFNINLFWTVF